MTSPRFRVPARVETERLTPRRFAPGDAPALVETITRNVAHLRRYMEWIKVEPQTVQQRRAWIAEVNRQFDAGEDYTLGMFGREGTLLGGSGYHAPRNPDRLEIGFWIDQEHVGQGLVTEAAAALTWVGLTIAGAQIVDITHVPSNTRSAAVAERLGFERQAAESHLSFDSGEMVPGVMWWATRETLAREPLASTPRPEVFDAEGTPIPWSD